jgi:valine--pyruvate aminotransferase
MSLSPFAFSEIGSRLSGRGGIVELMDDLSQALGGSTQGTMRMLGGGNPAAIPAMQALWRQRLADILADAPYCDRMLVNYESAAGNPAFREIVADCFRREFDWKLSADNVAVTSGGQAAFFQLINLFGGSTANGLRRILLPIMPEYIGYADQGLTHGVFAGGVPRIELQGETGFKYHVDFERLESEQSLGAVALSRPTNPSGNVLADDEVARLRTFAQQRGVPLILDNAYGLPFPGAIYTEARLPVWGEDLILVFSLSKLGLPGLRTAVVLAHPEIVRRMASLTAVLGLANNNVGQAVVAPLLANGKLLEASREIIKPFYAHRRRLALETIAQHFRGFPYRIHASEGAFFLWLWFPQLPLPTRELYERLKRRQMLLVPGEYFFFGLPSDLQWPHRHQCVRITYSQSEESIVEGLRILADELRRVHGAG